MNTKIDIQNALTFIRRIEEYCSYRILKARKNGTKAFQEFGLYGYTLGGMTETHIELCETQIACSYGDHELERDSFQVPLDEILSDTWETEYADLQKKEAARKEALRKQYEEAERARRRAAEEGERAAKASKEAAEKAKLRELMAKYPGIAKGRRK